MKVVVSTPTGNVGSRVVQLLIQAGVRPTLLAHHPARLDPAISEHADVVETDLSDAATVVRQTQGADALFWASPATFDPAVSRADFVAEDKRTVVTTTPTTLAAWASTHLRPAFASGTP